MAIDTMIFLDYASTTPLDPRAEEEMRPFWRELFYNPGSLHAGGVAAQEALASYRERLARTLGCGSDEIIFTSGGTEANNLALIGRVEYLRRQAPERPLHAITTAIEHPSVLDVFAELERRGVTVDYLKPDADGVVSADAVAAALREETALVSVMFVNNEIGTLQPVRDIARAVARHRDERQSGAAHTAVMHSDASQAPEYCDVNMHALGVDMLSTDGQKVYGPKQIGALCLRRHVRLQPLLYGGGQQEGLRPGTEPLPLIAGFTKALEIAQASFAEETERVRVLRDRLYDAVAASVPNVQVNGGMESRAPNNLNIYIPGLDAEYAALQLDARGVAVGTRSACMKDEGGSYVLRALGKGEDVAHGSLRFTLGRGTNEADVDTAAEALAAVAGTRE